MDGCPGCIGRIINLIVLGTLDIQSTGITACIAYGSMVPFKVYLVTVSINCGLEIIERPYSGQIDQLMG